MIVSSVNTNLVGCTNWYPLRKDTFYQILATRGPPDVFIHSVLQNLQACVSSITEGFLQLWRHLTSGKVVQPVSRWFNGYAFQNNNFR